MSSLVYLLAWSPPPHIPYISLPNQYLLFRAHAHTIATCFAVVSILDHLFLVFLSTPYLELFYLNIIHPSDHSHLCSLKCHLIFFPDRPGLTSVQHTTSHTTALQPSSPNQWYIPIGKQWYQAPELIPSNTDSGLHRCISISIHTQHMTYDSARTKTCHFPLKTAVTVNAGLVLACSL